MRLPSGLKAALTTTSRWPRRIMGSPEPSACQTRTVLSAEVVTMRCASSLSPRAISFSTRPKPCCVDICGDGLNASCEGTSTTGAVSRRPSWLNGTAIYFVSRLDEFKRFPVPSFYQSYWFSKAMSFFTLFAEFALGTFIWFKETRYQVLFLGVLLHLGLDYTMNVPFFQWIALSGFLVFVDAEKWQAWAEGLRSVMNKKLGKPTPVFYDGDIHQSIHGKL